jgi:hypothetical protein
MMGRVHIHRSMMMGIRKGIQILRMVVGVPELEVITNNTKGQLNIPIYL